MCRISKRTVHVKTFNSLVYKPILKVPQNMFPSWPQYETVTNHIFKAHKLTNHVKKPYLLLPHTLSCKKKIRFRRSFCDWSEIRMSQYLAIIHECQHRLLNKHNPIIFLHDAKDGRNLVQGNGAERARGFRRLTQWGKGSKRGLDPFN